MEDSPHQTDYEAGPSWSVEFAGRVLAIALNLSFLHLVSIRAIVATVFVLAANNALAGRIGAFSLALSIHRLPFSLCRFGKSNTCTTQAIRSRQPELFSRSFLPSSLF
jgi:hypothetical protein